MRRGRRAPPRRTTPERPEAAADPARGLARLLGLGVRGRLVTVGVEQVRRAALRGQLVCVLVAPDASAHGKQKIVPLLRARRVEVIDAFDARTLGEAVGRETTTAIGILDEHLANGVRALVKADPGGSQRRTV